MLFGHDARAAREYSLQDLERLAVVAAAHGHLPQRDTHP